MARRDGPIYTIAFSAVVFCICAILVSVSAVTLKSRQESNKQLDVKRNVLLAAGLISSKSNLEPRGIAELYSKRIRLESIDVNRESFSIYKVIDDDRIEMLVLPIEGKGLWSTMYGFLALDGRDPKTVRGIAFYEHGETPGLGGEVDNPRWRALWNGRQAFDENFNPVISLAKGPAGSAKDDPHRVDGLSGATMTSNGVTAMVRFWLGEDGFGPYLKSFSKRRGER
jgi:Na+-transporting NADH:ubiquinone oxidoreductase subunit C